MLTGLAMLLSAVLAVLSIVSLAKNFLISFNVSDNGYKTVLMVVLAVVCLLCAVIGYSEAYTVKDINVMEASPDINQAQVDLLKNTVPARTTAFIGAIGIGYVTYFLHLLLIANVSKNKQEEIKSSASRRWTHV